jgi:hypothetical protein
MTEGFAAPTLENMCSIFWGSGWQACLADALGVAEDEVRRWEAEPERRPAHLRDSLEIIGFAQMDKIENMLSLMTIAGLSGSGK